MGRADLDPLSRLENLRAASERARDSRAGNAQHNGDVSAVPVPAAIGGSVARQDRGAEAGLLGLETLFGGPPLLQGSCARAAVEGLRQGTGGVRGSRYGPVRGYAGNAAACGRRHNLSI